MTVLIMMNNYFHDFAVAVLISNLILFFAFTRGLRGELALNDAQLTVVYRVAKWVSVGSLIWIAIGGAIRTYHYGDFEWVEAAGKGQLVALGVKHTVMGGCTIVGLWLQLRMSREFGHRISGRRESA